MHQISVTAKILKILSLAIIVKYTFIFILHVLSNIFIYKMFEKQNKLTLLNSKLLSVRSDYNFECDVGSSSSIRI